MLIHVIAIYGHILSIKSIKAKPGKLYMPLINDWWCLYIRSLGENTMLFTPRNDL